MKVNYSQLGYIFKVKFKEAQASVLLQTVYQTKV